MSIAQSFTVDAGATRKMGFFLYKNNIHEPYLKLHLFVNAR